MSLKSVLHLLHTIRTNDGFMKQNEKLCTELMEELKRQFDVLEKKRNARYAQSTFSVEDSFAGVSSTTTAAVAAVVSVEDVGAADARTGPA